MPESGSGPVVSQEETYHKYFKPGLMLFITI